MVGRRNFEILQEDFSTPKHSIITDATDEGLGGRFELLSISGRFCDSENDLHINAKELLAAFKHLKALCVNIKNSTINI